MTRRVSKITRNEQIDLLIGFITSANIIATIAAKLNNIPCLISERNNPLSNSIPKFWLILRKHVYPMANHLIVQTKNVKQIYVPLVKSRDISILPNPLSSELSLLRNETHPRENIILSVGRLTNDKQHHKLINAFHTLEPEGWKVMIIGAGPKKESLIELIKSHDLGDKIEILSHIKDIHNYYNKASLFVFTSKSEGFPNALLEAMHFSLPCISTDCDFGPSDLINDGVNGFLVPVDDQNLLTSKMSELIYEEKLRTQFSEKARETSEQYTSKKVTAQWDAIIKTHIK
ncbi:glycosyltransferase [Gelidibacter salicanalis]|uniref:Glycosyltransferase n=1 Tax=Gelidibacter salicanalis TaxID=291193 RepID=A0A934KZV2_9FLAO|nr:glycosyltransferase [Gelidibacter salicanalis]